MISMTSNDVPMGDDSEPFSEGDVAYHHRHTTPPDPRSAVPDLPEALATLILQCMELLAQEVIGLHEVVT